MTSPQTATLTDWLLARVAEDEANVWDFAEVDRPHVLAVCAAHRRIVERHQPTPMLDHYEYGCTCGFSDHRWSECRACGAHLDDEGEYDRGIRGRVCPDLAALASIYADRPGFREEWRL
jgi:hypothetical protein